MISDHHDVPQNDPYAYWCPRCWRFVLDCTHLTWALETKHVPLKDWQYRYVAYDRKAENSGTRSQYRCRVSAPRGALGARIGNGESGKPRRILQAIDTWEVSVRSSADLASVSSDARAGVGGFAPGMNGTFNGIPLRLIVVKTIEPAPGFERTTARILA